MAAFMPLIIILAGLSAIAGSAMDADFFMENRKARIWVSLFGRNGARVFYIVLGILLTGMGLFLGMAGPL